MRGRGATAWFAEREPQKQRGETGRNEEEEEEEEEVRENKERKRKKKKLLHHLGVARLLAPRQLLYRNVWRVCVCV